MKNRELEGQPAAQMEDIYIAKLRRPNRDKRSLLERTAAVDKDIIALMRDNLSCGREACIRTLSRVMPRNSKHVGRAHSFLL